MDLESCYIYSNFLCDPCVSCHAFPVLRGNLDAFATYDRWASVSLYNPIVLHLHLTVSHCIQYLVSLWQCSSCFILVSGVLSIVPSRLTSPSRCTFVLCSCPDRSPADWPVVLNQLRFLRLPWSQSLCSALAARCSNLVLYKMCTIEFKGRKALNCLQLKMTFFLPGLLLVWFFSAACSSCL